MLQLSQGHVQETMKPFSSNRRMSLPHTANMVGAVLHQRTLARSEGGHVSSTATWPHLHSQSVSLSSLFRAVASSTSTPHARNSHTALSPAHPTDYACSTQGPFLALCGQNQHVAAQPRSRARDHEAFQQHFSHVTISHCIHGRRCAPPAHLSAVGRGPC